MHGPVWPDVGQSPRRLSARPRLWARAEKEGSEARSGGGAGQEARRRCSDPHCKPRRQGQTALQPSRWLMRFCADAGVLQAVATKADGHSVRATDRSLLSGSLLTERLPGHNGAAEHAELRGLACGAAVAALTRGGGAQHRHSWVGFGECNNRAGASTSAFSASATGSAS